MPKRKTKGRAQRATKKAAEETEETRKPRGPGPAEGTGAVWPTGVEKRYGIKPVTRWRWERDKKLPPRDLFVGGRSGWRPETLESFERGERNA